MEAFIRQVYLRQFDAAVQQFAPTLVSLHGAEDIVAAAGYRGGHEGPLFLERYLQRPIERLLADDGTRKLDRRTIVEVGHLSSSKAGEGRRLIALLAAHLESQGFDWVVTTVTAELLRLFMRLGLAPRALGVADPSALGDEASHWGRYYEHQPTVVCGRLSVALLKLAHHSPSLHDRA